MKGQIGNNVFRKKVVVAPFFQKNMVYITQYNKQLNWATTSNVKSLIKEQLPNQVLEFLEQICLKYKRLELKP